MEDHLRFGWFVLFAACGFQKSKNKKIKVVEVGNICLTGCQVANRYYKANYACITIVHHVTGEKISLFLTLRLFLQKMVKFCGFGDPQ